MNTEMLIQKSISNAYRLGVHIGALHIAIPNVKNHLDLFMEEYKNTYELSRFFKIELPEKVNQLTKREEFEDLFNNITSLITKRLELYYKEKVYHAFRLGWVAELRLSFSNEKLNSDLKSNINRIDNEILNHSNVIGIPKNEIKKAIKLFNKNNSTNRISVLEFINNLVNSTSLKHNKIIILKIKKKLSIYEVLFAISVLINSILILRLKFPSTKLAEIIFQIIISLIIGISTFIISRLFKSINQ